MGPWGGHFAGVRFSCAVRRGRRERAKCQGGTGEVPAALDGVIDLAGHSVNPFGAKTKVTVLIFLNPDCPISNRYAPEIQRLAKAFEPKDATFWLVYPDPDLWIETIQKHLKEYGYSLRALRDPRHVLVKRSHAQVTPEAAVFTADDRLVYRGRNTLCLCSLSYNILLCGPRYTRRPSAVKTAASGVTCA